MPTLTGTLEGGCGALPDGGGALRSRARLRMAVWHSGIGGDNDVGVYDLGPGLAGPNLGSSWVDLGGVGPDWSTRSL